MKSVALDLSLGQLQVVQAVLESASVTNAANRLHLTQPAVSYQLKQAEQRLGVTLFDRRAGRMEATPVARRIARCANSIQDELQSAARDIQTLLAGRSGVLRLSTVCSTAYHWLPGVLDIFKSEYPEVDVVLDTSLDRMPVEEVQRGELDIALTTDPNGTSDVIATPLFMDEIVVIVEPNHPFAGRKYLGARDFKQQTVLSFDHRRSDLFLQVLRPAGVNPRRVIDVEATEALVAMVEVGLGVGAVARWMVLPQINAGQVVAVRVTKKGLRRTWMAVTSNQSGTPRYIRRFVEILRKETVRNTTRSP